MYFSDFKLAQGLKFAFLLISSSSNRFFFNEFTTDLVRLRERERGREREGEREGERERERERKRERESKNE